MCVMLMLFFTLKTSIFRYFFSARHFEVLDFKEIFKEFRGLPPEIRPKTLSNLELVNDEKLVINTKGYPSVVLDLSVTKPNFQNFHRKDHSSTQLISFYSLEFLSNLLKLYEETGNALLLKLSKRFIEFWKMNRIIFGLEPFCWYDHTTAMRMFNSFLSIGVLVKIYQDSEKISGHLKVLYTEYYACSRFLLKSYNYDYISNHGLIVDYYLLLICYLDKQDKILSNHSLKKVAIHRSVHRVDYFISEDGVILEPATSYWFMILNLLEKINALLPENERNADLNFLKKLQAAKSFISKISINGQFIRLGDSSGGHDFQVNGDLHHDLGEGYSYFLSDAGLFYVNGVRDKQTVFQFMFNIQNTPPFVHRHQDALSISIFHEGIFWIDAPGYFSPDMKKFGVNVRNSENQSSVISLTSGYSNNCRVESLCRKRNKVIILASCILDSGSKLFREINFDPSNNAISIIDQSEDSGILQSNFLLAPKVKVDNISGHIYRLSLGKKYLNVELEAEKIEIQEAGISFYRNRMEETKKIVATGKEIVTKITWSNNVSSKLLDISSGNYPYKGRAVNQSQRLTFFSKSLKRFHKKRLFQLMIVSAFIYLIFTLFILQLP